AKLPVKRTLERRQASASGHDAVGAAGVLSLTSPRRNAAEVGAGGAHIQTPALGPIASPAKRTSVQQRAEHNPLQPRLHLKGPAPGVDGRFALTADNIEWHLRLIPPMKESKYDWIVRYVQEQQQNVAAAAAEPSQHQRDIESSMLMTGQMQYEYVGPNYLDHRAVAAAAAAAALQQQQQQQHLQQQQLQLQMMHAPVHSRAHISNVNGNVNNNNNNYSPHQVPPPIQQSLTNNTNTTGNAAQREAGMLPPDNEEDDNTPLAAINTSLSPRQQPTQSALQPTSLSIGHVSCLDKYMTGSLNDPLPEPVSPTRGARLSLMSFQSNMAVNMDTPDIHAISRSHSISNPQSASILDSNYRVTPVARSPTGHDSGPPLFAANPIAARQLSCPISIGSNRPSLNIVSRSRQNQKLDDENSDDEGDNEPLLPQRPSTVNALLRADNKQSARTPSIQSKPPAHVLSDAESDPTPALRVVNQVSSHDSDESADGRDFGDMQVVPRTPLLASGGYADDEDDRPLMQLTERVDQRPPPFLNVNTSVARPPITSYSYSHNSPDDDDNRPLSSLMMLAQNATDDLGGSLPLPAPRHVIDPDAVVNISDIINETVTPPRTSLGERPTSPLISTGSTRKHSLLLHAFHPGGQGSETTGGAVAGGTELVEPSLSEMSSAVNNARSAFPLKRRSNLSSGCSGQPAMRGSIATNRTSSLPQSLKLVTDNPDPILINQQHQLVSYSFDASEAIGEGSGENDDGELSIGNSADSSSKRRQDASHALAVLESGQADGTTKRPWAMNRAHSASALSLASSRRAPRGSMLGQQLTDELHMLRDNLARSRREYEKSERRSWQVGDPPAVQQPWVRHENTMSDTALPQKLSSLRPDSANGQGGDVNEVTTQDETTKVPSPWSYVDKQRPMSTQQPRTSKWFAKGSNSRVFHARQQSKDDIAPGAAAVQPASPQSVHSTSLSSRISNQLGKLKRTFKHGAGV
ncbi:hypothetical protein IW146_009737, partial [Coemansia sp. RSA 922]